MGIHIYRISCSVHRKKSLLTEMIRSDFFVKLCAPGERTFYRVKVPSPPGSGKG